MKYAGIQILPSKLRHSFVQALLQPHLESPDLAAWRGLELGSSMSCIVLPQRGRCISGRPDSFNSLSGTLAGQRICAYEVLCRREI